MEKFWFAYNPGAANQTGKKFKTYGEAALYASEQVAQNKAVEIIILEAISHAKRKDVPVVIEPIKETPLNIRCGDYGQPVQF